MANGIKVKLCGFKEPIALSCAIQEGVDFVGFVFCLNSPRFVSFEDAQKLAPLVPSHVAKVAVFRQAEITDLHKAYQALQPQYFQLHGNYSKNDLLNIQKHFPTVKIIYAVNIGSENDLQQAIDFSNAADIILFDSKNAGSGQAFDWKILQDFSSQENGPRKWFLSGGLNSANIIEALEITQAKMIDISSGIEEQRGVKSVALIKEFMHKIKNIA